MIEDPPDATSPARDVRAGTHLAVICFYTVVAAVVTWPLALHFSDEVIAEHYADRLQNLWNIWWVKVALLDLHTNPFHTDLLVYPQGIDLYFHTLNLPTTLATIPPFLLFGLAVAYNFSVFFALVLSSYAGFRLVLYLTRNPVAAIVGGLIIGFNPLSSVMIRAQINIASLQWFILCIEFFLRAWNSGSRRDSLLVGLFFSLAVLTVGYFEIYLLLFFLAFLLWAVLARSYSGQTFAQKAWMLFRRAQPLLGWGGGAALLLIGPYAVGAWLSLQKGQIAAGSTGDEFRIVLNSADLLSFIVPNRNHWLLGQSAPWWGWVSPGIHDYTYLGFVTLALAGAGAWHRRRRSMTWLWVALAVAGVVLALGPVLQVNNSQTVGSFQVAMPLGLLQNVPLLGLVRSPERFVVLAYLALGVLASWGLTALMQRYSTARGAPVAALVIGLLLLEMPLRPRYLEPITIPGSLSALAQERSPGAVLELPLTQHGRVDVHRMFFETAHGHPITSGYISRDVIDPYLQGCSPLRIFQSAPADILRGEARDIVSPTVLSQPIGALLTTNGFGFVAVYKQGFYDQEYLTPVPQGLLSTLQEVGRSLGTSIADDGMATVYRLRPSNERVGFFLQLGEGWHALQESYAQPFRWIDGGRAEMCVFDPAQGLASLTLQASSFDITRHLQIWVGNTQVAEVAVPADGALHPVVTPPISWPAGPQRVRFVVPEGSASPAQLGQGADKRQLSIGLSAIRVRDAAP
jgi:hypothetical protein